jgi:pimeloyl-ACP methyl ester carboxylesterase
MFLWIAIVVAVLIAAIVGFSYWFAHSILRVPRQPREDNPETDLPLQLIEVQGQAGALRGWFISHSSNEKRPAILLTHGWGRNAAQMLPYAEFLFGQGYNLCLFDVRGHGNSDRDKDGYMAMPRYAHDIITMARYCCERADVDAARLGHLGHSMGASSSFRAAHEGRLFRCMVASSGFADLRDLVRWVLRGMRLPSFPFQPLIQYFWRRILEVTVEEVNPIDLLPRLDLPIFVAHGDQDPIVPHQQLEKLLAHARNGNVKGLLLPGRRHSDLHADGAYVRAIQDFFAAHL